MAATRARPGLAAAGVWARSELRRRWRALVALGVIAGLAGGLTLAAVAGARRTSSAYSRFREATAAPDAIVFATQVGIMDQDYSAVTKLPEVVDAGTFTLAPVGIEEHPEVGTLAPGDTRLYRTISRPLLVEGRLPDPRRDDEILVNNKAAARFHLRVGQRVTLVSSRDIEAFFTSYLGGPPLAGGPSVRATIVGIGDSAMDQVFFAEDPGFIPSGGFLRRHPEVPRAPNLVLRLRPGTDVNAFHRKAAAALGLPDVPVRDLAEDRKRVTHGTDLERTGLLLFAAAVALAGLVLVGQALTRTVYAMAEPAPSLRALGLSGPEVMVGLVLPLVVTATTAAVVSVATAVAVSPRFPVGLARRLEPDPGVHADWAVLAVGAALVLGAVLAGAALGARRAVRASGTALARAGGSALLRRIRTTAPLPVAIGAGLALEAGRGDRTLPVRPAIAGAVAAVLGVVGALGLVRGIDDALARPRRAGQVWDAQIYSSEPTVLERLRRDPMVGAIAMMGRTPLDVEGAGVPAYTIGPVQGRLSFVVLRGRAPRAPGEVALGPATAKALGKDVGDRVHVGGPRGLELRIVGTALMEQTAHTSFDQGVWATPADVGKLDVGEPVEDDRSVLVTARAGVEPDALVSHLRSRFDAVEGPTTPQDVLFLRNVRPLPHALAAFLVLLGLAALGHALVTAVRRRRHDLAVLKAIGFRPAQNAACIAWQAMTVAAVGLVLGLPLGAVAGRLSWRWVADATPLLYEPPLAVTAVALAVPAAVAAANLLAALPARRAARLRPAEVLRSE